MRISSGDNRVNVLCNFCWYYQGKELEFHLDTTGTRSLEHHSVAATLSSPLPVAIAWTWPKLWWECLSIGKVRKIWCMTNLLQKQPCDVSVRKAKAEVPARNQFYCLSWPIVSVYHSLSNFIPRRCLWQIVIVQLAQICHCSSKAPPWHVQCRHWFCIPDYAH